MAIEFPGRYPDKFNPERHHSISVNHQADDVVESISRLPSKAQYISAWHHDSIPALEYVTIDNHFQGICRLQKEDFFIISGGSKKSSVAQLFIIKIESAKVHRSGAVGSNVIHKPLNEQDTLLDIICLHEGPMWHAGGISLCGDVLLVPLEGELALTGKKQHHSRIEFYDVSDPLKIYQLPYQIDRRLQKAGAVSMMKQPSGVYILVIWTDSDKGSKRFDFYVSTTRELQDGFELQDSVSLDDIFDRKGRDPSFQSIDLILQKDGRMFLTAYCNTRKTAPTIDGTNQLYLYELKSEQGERGRGFSLHQLLIKSFDKGKHQYNMAAATGLHVTQRGRLILYGAHHWLTGKHINVAEFAETLNEDARKIRTASKGIIELYEHKHCKGRVLTLYGDLHAQIESYKKIKVQGASFNDKVSSLRYQLAKGESYTLYEHEYFTGRKYLLVGTGKTVVVNDLESFNDLCSSSRYEALET